MSGRRDELSDKLKAVVRLMLEDYRNLGKVEVFRVRDDFFRSFYVPTPFRGGVDQTVVFVDSGHTGKSYSTDSFYLVLMNVGGVLRNGEKIEYFGHRAGGPEVEGYILYASITSDGFKVTIHPLDDNSLLVDTSRAEVVSKSLTSLVTRGYSGFLRGGLDFWEVGVKYFRRVANYLISLVELSYCVKVLSTIKDSICVLDGTLIRWFGAVKLRAWLGFDGLDIASILSGVSREEILSRYLWRIYGIAKTTKFTVIARSRALLSTVGGGYGSISLESVERAAKFLRDLGARSKSFTEHLLNIVNPPVFHSDDYTIHALRTPVTVDGVNVFMFGLYTRGPLIDIRQAYAVNEGVVGDSSGRLSTAVESIFARLTRAPGYPPLGFLEVDALVRLKKEYITNKFEPRMLVSIIEQTGGKYHPLAEFFRPGFEKRLGYVRGRT
ncbi:hypothetical protein WLZ34_05590 [Thermogladius sp. KZ2Tp1]|uniref:hypothetical protein n=1 Tax=Thermogladius sp. KZ2Tp1 TaxID=3136289 RepID=UPI003DAA273D